MIKAAVAATTIHISLAGQLLSSHHLDAPRCGTTGAAATLLEVLLGLGCTAAAK
jgi:hypothetical protein